MGPSGVFSQLAVLETIRLTMTPDLVASIAATIGAPGLPGAAWWHHPSGTWAPLAAETELPADGPFRIALEPARAVALLPSIGDVAAEDLPACVTLDVAHLQFPNVPPEASPLSIIGGAWAAWPSSEFMAPPPAAPQRDERQWSPADGAELLNERFNSTILTPLLGVLAADRSRFAPPIYQRTSLPPTSYLAVPSGDRPETGDEWLAPGRWRSLLLEVTKPFLEIYDPQDARLAASVAPQTGTLVLYRHFEAASAWPAFLFLPAGTQPEERFELDVIVLARSYDAVDTLALYRQWDAVTDLEMITDRIGDFRLIGDEAAGTVNPLLLALAAPEQEGSDRVRQAVDLVRTVLVQSGPELIALRRMIERQRDSGDTLRAWGRQTTRQAGLRAPVGFTGVEDALVDSRFEPLTAGLARADAAMAGVTPVRELIENTASVLAERREQTLARLAGVGYTLNIAVGVLAGAAAVDLLVHFNWQATWPWVSPTLRVLSILGFVALGVWFLTRRRADAAGTPVGDVDLRSLRADVVDFLDRATVIQLLPAVAPEVDLERARHFARLWDALTLVSARLDADRPDLLVADRSALLDHWIKRAEYWACSALLIGERPFPLTSDLPLVTCLLHFRTGGRFVSAFEFRLALRDVPLEVAEAFRQWGCQEGPAAPSTAELLDVVVGQLGTITGPPAAVEG